MTFFRRLAAVTTAVSAILLSLLPIAVAIDFGGVLWWTQYVAALVIGIAFALALPSVLSSSAYHRPRHLLLLIPLLVWLAYSAFQTIALSPGLVQSLSPASYAAYTQWLQPILPADLLPKSFSLSVAPDDSAHAVALFGIIFMLAWCSLRVFNTRLRLIGLLSCVAITGATVSVLGIVALTLPGLPFFESMSSSNDVVGFSTFVNRNNAALTLNFGLAASLGLLGWRLSALSGQEIDGDDFKFHELFSLASDRDSAIGLLCAVLCVVGLLVCGSRAGLGAAVFAIVISLGWIRRKKGMTTIPVMLAVVAIASAFLIVPLQLNLNTIKRLEVFSSDTKTLLNDGRLAHWPEGWDTAMQHLPAGSGLSTYAYAYLPNQTDVNKPWFLHADNLWLELWVEQGVVGIPLAILLLMILAWSLTALSHSHDALDHGIRITGWYCLVAVVFSQCFDFGLIVPANLILFVLIMGGIVSRSCDAENLKGLMHGVGLKISKWTEKGNIRRLSSLLALLIAITGTGIALVAIPCLRIDAASDTTVRTARQQIAGGQRDPEALQRLKESLIRRSPETTPPRERMILGEIDHRLARMQEVARTDPTSPQEATERYQLTSPTYRRLIGTQANEFISHLPASFDQAPFAASDSLNEYRQAAEHYQQSLVRLPLAPLSRGHLLTLDFATEPNESRSQFTRSLLEQLGELHRAHPQQLHSLAALAAQSGLNDMAAQYWNRSLVQRPSHSVNVMNAIKRYKNIDLLSALPKNAKVMRSAANYVLTRKRTQHYPLLTTMAEHFECDDCKGMEDQSKCFRLTGKAHLAVDEVEEAAESFSEAIIITPTNATLRLELIHALRQIGDTKTALQQARTGRQITPTDKRFDSVIRQMAALDRVASPKAP